MSPIRSTVPIPEEVQEATAAGDQREELGFPRRGPVSQIYAQLMLDGLRMRQAARKRREALDAYAEWSRDSEHREAVQELTRIAEDAGWL